MGEVAVVLDAHPDRRREDLLAVAAQVVGVGGFGQIRRRAQAVTRLSFTRAAASISIGPDHDYSIGLLAERGTHFVKSRWAEPRG